MATSCYCRGAAICDQGHHTCTDCTCDTDGAPQEQPTAYGHANPSTARLAAWQQKQEARR
ncbi:hypothetical protein GCM10007170_15920 [Arthrobacter liuii]|uniref:Metallothionein n=1 Tax=Arthrobacter liuii TaxID=1476996 RepID=A0ABQ2APP2_9MICC|nr:hypothetical protein GCM10007170_15920 [Arthrobacter liuii]